jgi:o-succinylbenzoate synthase
MLKATWKRYTLNFKQPSGTSRGVLKEKNSWFIVVHDASSPDIFGIGECGLLKGLSIDDVPGYEGKLQEVCDQINQFDNKPENGLKNFPSIRFGLEVALADLRSGGRRILYESPFTHGEDSIEINGLVWMGSYEFMHQQIRDKLESGYRCIKLKIGALNFDEELQLINKIRKEFSALEIEIRVDANGAFSPDEALKKLEQLAEYEIHSIEQPIKQDQWEKMAVLCENTPLPIALDEELIGVEDFEQKSNLLKMINPQYIILKPSLVGGFKDCEEWIGLAEENNTSWWVTSALESNIGLNAIAQWTYTLKNKMPQGLGTGQLYTNNFLSPLYIETGKLKYHPMLPWDFNFLIHDR